MIAGVAVFGLSLMGLYAKHKSQVIISEAQQEFKKFISMHKPPEDIIQKIEEALAAKNIEKIQQGGDNWIGLTERLCIKCGHDIRRVINAERARKVIENNNLTCLRVPKKYIYKIEGRWAIIAECIQKSEKNTPITLEEIQQLVKFIELTGFSDLNYLCPNIIRDNNTKLVFIDTEDRSFRLQSLCHLLYSRCGLKQNIEFCISGVSGVLTSVVSRYIDSYEASASVSNITLRTDLDGAHSKIALVKRYRSYLEARNTISAIKNYLSSSILDCCIDF